MDPEDATRQLPPELLALRENLQPRLLRELIQQVLSSEPAFDAFCQDVFPKVKRQFGAAMGHLAKETLLLQSVDKVELFDALCEYDLKRMIRVYRRIQAAAGQGKKNGASDADRPPSQASVSGAPFWKRQTIWLIVFFMAMILFLYQCTMYVVFAPTADSVTAKPRPAPVSSVGTAGSATLSPDVAVPLGAPLPDAATADSARGVDVPKPAEPPVRPPPAAASMGPSPRSEAPGTRGGPARATRK